MHDDTRLIEGRLGRSLQRLDAALYSDTAPLSVTRWDAPGEPVEVADALAAPYRDAAVGDPWGPAWGTTWFHLTGAVPDSWRGRTIEARVDLGFEPGQPGFQAEGLVYRPDATAVKGLNPRTSWIPAPGSALDVFVEAAANPIVLAAGFDPTPLGDVDTAGREPLYRLRRAELAVFETGVWELIRDLEVLGQLAGALGGDDARRFELWRAVDRALDVLDGHDLRGSASAARSELAAVFAAPARASAHRVVAVGHAHIDSAWLWPTRETVRKVARTAANVTELMDHDDDLIYAMSSAQQFTWLEHDRPEIYARVAERVRAGRFIPVGGMWVESDTNMPGGEALARQFAHGKRYFLDKFGIDTQEVWLPDSFGYTAALPQLIALSGSRWFLTQKISWSETNAFPHHTFRWEGLDGTRIFTHFPPVDTYNSELSGSELAHAARSFRDKGAATTSLVLFGHGDGGGGPTREMLARAKRLADLDGSPRVRIQTPREFFARAEAEYPDAPVWVGELYLEFHRGTYSSLARVKKGNRLCEHLLREAELWCATAAVQLGREYPYEALDRIWKLVLLQQFHDILPGSSIRWVNREAIANYRSVAAELNAIVDGALDALAGDGDVELAFNAAPDPRRGVAALGAGTAAAVAPTSVVDGADGWTLDNGTLRVRVDPRGLITSLLDVGAHREVIAPGGAGNLLQIHPDTPNAWDAWNVDSFYRHRVTDLVDVEPIEPVDGGVVIRRRFSASQITQTITLDGRRVDIDTEVEWHERETLLKAGFDVDVTADRSAAEIQFGHVFRPTHTNTSWDAAKFEICAHRWIHVGEPGYGVAVVNDSSYGHDVTRRSRAGGGTSTRVRLSLLRAPRFPDPEADQGAHHMRYALVIGASIADAVREGYRTNLPLRTTRGAHGQVAPLLEVRGAGVVVESLKLADDRSGDVVLRLYEALGGRARAEILPGFLVRAVAAVDLLERDRAETALHTDDGIHVDLRPFQILTLRLGRT